MLFTKVFYEDKEIQDERLEWTDKGSLYFVGPNLTLTNCTLVLKVPARNLFFEGVRFVNCTFEVKQELKKKQQWVLASLKGCKFKGNLSDCDFGHWPGHAPGWEHGFIEDCDFTEARMDGCRIMGCDPATVRFPKWPCFTLLDPVRNSRQNPGQYERCGATPPTEATRPNNLLPGRTESEAARAMAEGHLPTALHQVHPGRRRKH